MFKPLADYRARSFSCHGRELLPRIVLRRDFGALTVSVRAKKGLVTKKDRRAFSMAARRPRRLSGKP